MDITDIFFGKIDGLIVFKSNTPKEKIIGLEQYIQQIKSKRA